MGTFDLMKIRSFTEEWSVTTYISWAAIDFLSWKSLGSLSGIYIANIYRQVMSSISAFASSL